MVLDPRVVRRFVPLGATLLSIAAVWLPWVGVDGGESWSGGDLITRFMEVPVPAGLALATVAVNAGRFRFVDLDRAPAWALGRFIIAGVRVRLLLGAIVLALASGSAVAAWVLGFPCPAGTCAAFPRIGWGVVILATVVGLLAATAKAGRPWMTAQRKRAESPNAEERVAAAEALHDGLLDGYSEDLTALADLFLRLARDPDPEVRAASSWGLVTVFKGAPARREALAGAVEALTHDADKHVRGAGASVIQFIGSEEDLSERWRQRLIERLMVMAVEELEAWPVDGEGADKPALFALETVATSRRGIPSTSRGRVDGILQRQEKLRATPPRKSKERRRGPG